MIQPSPLSRLHRARPAARLARGSFLLEALISVLIVSLAILGLLGLMARGMQDVDESKMRGEASLLAASYIGSMWVSDRTLANLQATFGPGGIEYNNLQTVVAQRLPNGLLANVTITPGAVLPTSADVEIEIRWTPPGMNLATAPLPYHKYETFATVGGN